MIETVTSFLSLINFLKGRTFWLSEQKLDRAYCLIQLLPIDSKMDARVIVFNWNDLNRSLSFSHMKEGMNI